MTGPNRFCGDVSDAAKHELITGWRVLLGSMLGMGVGIIALPTPAIAVTMRSLQDEFGWTRTEISLGPTILLTTLMLMAPVLGWVADRIAASKIVVVSLGGLSACLFVFSQIGPSLAFYYAMFVLLGVVGCGTATLVYARVISIMFVRERGLALGLALVGNGLSGILLPVLLTPYAAEHGWRAVFVVLAVVSALAIPILGFLLHRIEPATVSNPRTNPDLMTGKTFGDALRDRVLWAMMACFFLIPLAAVGMHLHFLAYLADAGVKPTTAGWLAGMIGAALIVGRILTGYLIDRFFAPLVGAVLMLFCATCMVIQGVWGAPAAVFGALALGLSIGAELDLVGYLASRYFGMKAFGRIYGLMYAMVLAGSSLSKVAYGLILDITGTYTIALYMATCLLLVSAGLFMTMRRFTVFSEHLAEQDVSNANHIVMAPISIKGSK